ncbi:hypothetical protein [Methylobacterium nigriterrae]|uniref:hypothetical protein n=1 Tax=Methylobacterium nigriterrae TaxID=3127512 RepID=UPI0030137A97
MSLHSATAALLLSLSLGALAAPAHAQETGTFDAWGHNFRVPGTEQALGRTAERHRDVLSSGSLRLPRSYASTGAGSSSASAVLPHVARTINVWGAHIDASVR